MPCLASLLLYVLPQEPVPLPAPEPTPPTPPPGQEQPQDPGAENGIELPPTLDEVMAEVMRLADVVRDGFRKVDTGLRDTRDQIDQAEQPSEVLLDGLERSVVDAGQLLTDIEELLETIPEIEGKGSGGGSNKPKPSESEPDQDPGQNQDASDENRPENAQENQEGEGAPPTSYLRLLFDQDAGAWGMLPPRLQEALQNAVIEDLPLRYRRLLDDFHRN